MITKEIKNLPLTVLAIIMRILDQHTPFSIFKKMGSWRLFSWRKTVLESLNILLLENLFLQESVKISDERYFSALRKRT